MKRKTKKTKQTDKQRQEEFCQRLVEFLNGVATEVYPDAPGYSEYMTFMLVGSSIAQQLGKKALKKMIKDLLTGLEN